MIPEWFNKFDKNMSFVTTNTILLSKAGSHSYGTNTADSDEDFKGCVIAPKEYYFSAIKNFEQAELKSPNPDCTLYDLRKFIKLCTNCNPNVIESLFVREQDYIHVSPIGQKLIDNRDLFLSKKIKFTTMGFAFSQIAKIKSHRKFFLTPKTKPQRSDFDLKERLEIPTHQFDAMKATIEKELVKYQFDFINSIDESVKIDIRNTMTKMLTELKLSKEDQWNAAVKSIGLQDNVIEILRKEREYETAMNEYHSYIDWEKNRNRTRYNLEKTHLMDTKHCSHVYRLVRMCREVLLTGKLNVYRDDHEELLAIRNGSVTFDQLIEFFETQEKELDEIYKTSNILPHQPNQKKIDELCVNLIEEFLFKG